MKKHSVYLSSLAPAVSVALTFAVGCGGPKTPETPKAPTWAAHDAVVAKLETLRPFVVSDAEQNLNCPLYTPAATEIVKALPAMIAAAAAERNCPGCAGPSLDAWQQAHNTALTALVLEVATPLRSEECEGPKTDKAWTHVSEAIVSVSVPRELPPVIVKRRMAVDYMLTAASKLEKADQCEDFAKNMQNQFANLESDIKAMPKLLAFVDDKVWEEQDEKTVEADPRLKKMMSICAPAGDDEAAPPPPATK
jgi:hypothetical protein